MRINPTTSGPEVSALEKKNLGRIAQIIGQVLDEDFKTGKMNDRMAMETLLVKLCSGRK